MAEKIVAGNWKMNLTEGEGLALIQEVNNYCSENSIGDLRVVMAPPALYLSEASKAAHASVHIAAQNCHDRDSGAFTGEISVPMLKDSGIHWVIIGHSERREYFKESGAFLNAKLRACLSGGVKPIFCVGELLDDRKAGRQEAVVETQLHEGFEGISKEALQGIVIAYEPVWAIGTGEVASPQQAQEMHAFIRSWISKNYGADIAASASILYGGSVKPENAHEIFGQADVNGGLIGGASLKAASFNELIRIGSEVL